MLVLWRLLTVVLSITAMARSTAGTSPSSEVSTNSGPKIQFALTTLDFGRLEAGKVVTNVYYFTNIGTQPLEIRDVNSSCGCAAAPNFTRNVEPGKSGNIPVIFDTTGKAGPTMKTLWVSCNDPGQSNVLLRFTATIWKPIDAIPVIAAFSFGPNFQTNLTRIIRLTSNLEEPVTLSEPVLTNRSFRAELKTVREGKEFELHVTVLPPLGPGSITAPIEIKTSTPKMPVVTVNAYALVQPALNVVPAQVRLRPGPFTNEEQIVVSIRNLSTNALVLTEPSLNAKGAGIQLREVQPGRQFELALTFPPGFSLAGGEKVEARIKSNFAQVPVLTIPIMDAANLAEPGSLAALLAREQDSGKASGSPDASQQNKNETNK